MPPVERSFKNWYNYTLYCNLVFDIVVCLKFIPQMAAVLFAPHDGLFFKGDKIMALIKFGGGVVQMAGSIAGTVFARNRYGNYARARTKPTNPNTARQQAVRGYLASLTTRWAQTLTAVQRTAWNLYASNVIMTNRLGESINLSGYNHYIRSNLWALDLAATPVDAGPTTFELPEKDGTLAVSISEATQLISLTFDDTAEWCDEDGAYLVILQGQPVNAQRNFFAGPFRGSVNVAGDSTTPPTSPQTVACVFQSTEGSKSWVQCRILRADGRLSEPFRASALVAA